MNAPPILRPADELPRDGQGRLLLKGLTQSELERWLVEELGERPFRVTQIWKWLYIRFVSSFEEMTDLSKGLREKLVELARVDAIAVDAVFRASDGTRKITWKLDSGAIIESVLIPSENRVTLCISSQVGCAMNCQFCLTAKMGLRGHLSTAEIVDQVAQTRRMFESEGHISNIVFMGMGEPLANFTNLTRALQILHGQWGLNIGARHITVSTSGLAPQIKKLADFPLSVRLAISLHGATDEVRSKIMPVNNKYPLEELFESLRYFKQRSKHKITFEYILIEGVNDGLDQARALARRTKSLEAKVNLIPYNTVEGLPWLRPSEEQQDAFCATLVANGVPATIRREKGHDIDAACGQLRLKQETAEGLV